jgi:hypothetical protein
MSKIVDYSTFMSFKMLFPTTGRTIIVLPFFYFSSATFGICPTSFTSLKATKLPICHGSKVELVSPKEEGEESDCYFHRLHTFFQIAASSGHQENRMKLFHDPSRRRERCSSVRTCDSRPDFGDCTTPELRTQVGAVAIAMSRSLTHRRREFGTVRISRTFNASYDLDTGHGCVSHERMQA